MKLRNLIFLLLLYALPLTLYPLPVYAQDIGQAKIHPASPVYFLKSFKEILELKVSKPDQKGLKYFEFAQRRIREVNALTLANRADLIPPALEKYSLYMEKVLGHLDFKNANLARRVLEYVKGHIISLDRVFGQTQNQRAKIAIRAAIFRLFEWHQSLPERLSVETKLSILPQIQEDERLICDFLSKEASSSALNDTEKAVLIERVQKCFQNLGSGRF